MKRQVKRGAMTAEKPKNVKKTMSRLLTYLKPYKGVMVVVFIGVVLQCIANIAGTTLLTPLIDGLTDSSKAVLFGQLYEDRMKFLAVTVSVIAAIYLIGCISNYAINRLLIGVSTKTMTTMRNQLFEHMQKLPIKVFDTTTHGELMSRYTNDIDMMNEFIARCLPQIVSSSIMIIGVYTMMWVLNWALTIIITVMVAIMIVVVRIIGGKSQKNFVAQQVSVGKLNGYVEEMVEGQKVIKAFNHENKAVEGFDVINSELEKVAGKANAYANILMPIMGNISHFFYALIAVLSALIIIAFPDLELITVGAITSFLLFIRNLSNPISQIAQQINVIFMAVAGGQRVFAILDTAEEVDDGYVTLVNVEADERGALYETEKRTGKWAWRHPHGDGKVTYTELKGDVRFANVTFGYEENKTVLKNITLYAEPGQKIAFVGSTGAGKTTITNLVNRFYDVPDGKIRYDGININKIKKADLRRSLGMVLQDTHLFTETVMENIRYGKLDATDDDCIAAAKSANAHQFIMHLPEGYSTMLTRDGENLSQGQRQLLAIARAAVADPPVLILDEATSSIDTRTEWLIEKGMDALMEGRTTFVIAHRLSTVRNSNAIMVLEHGKIIERGSHQDLLDLKGKYYQLYTGMFELS